MLFKDFQGSSSANESSECNAVPPQKDLSGYRRRPLQALYPQLLGVLSKVTLIDSRKFPLYYVSTSPLNLIPSLAISPQTVSLHYSLYLIPLISIHTCPQSTSKTHFPLSERSINSLLEPSLLLSLLGLRFAS